MPAQRSVSEYLEPAVVQGEELVDGDGHGVMRWDDAAGVCLARGIPHDVAAFVRRRCCGMGPRPRGQMMPVIIYRCAKGSKCVCANACQ